MNAQQTNDAIRRIDDNLDEHPDGTVVCRHCGAAVGDRADVLAHALRREGPPRAAGPAVRADAHRFTDRVIVLRQAFCAHCLVQLQAEIVPADEPSLRTRGLAR